MNETISIRKVLKTVGLTSAILVGTAFTSQASANIIDFTDNVWSDASALQSYSLDLGDVQVTVSSLPSTNTALFWDNEDGFGVSGLNDSNTYNDEIDYHDGDSIFEQIKISFSSVVTVNSFSVSDFFNGTGLFGAAEVGEVSFNGGTFHSFESTVSQAGDPEQSISLSASNVEEIIFRAGDSASDFAIQNLDISSVSVPEPPMFLLLGSVLALMFKKRRIN